VEVSPLAKVKAIENLFLVNAIRVLRKGEAGHRSGRDALVESARGAVLVLPPARFPGPLAEPAVPISR
jgi:hypothetical protein